MLNNSDIQKLKDIFFPKFDEINQRLDIAEKRIEFLMEEMFEMKQMIISIDKRLTSVEERLARLEESSYFSSQKITAINKTLKVAGKVLISSGQPL